MTEVGIILAGGLSRRMGGEEKSLMLLAGKHPISWVSERLAPQVDRLAINANGDAARFSFLDKPVIADTIDGFVGPLAGVLAGMAWAKQFSDVTHVVTGAADTPFIPSDLVKQLCSAAHENNGIAMAQSVGRVHPVFGYWPLALMQDLEDFLVKEDKRKILEFARRYPLSEVNFDKADSDPFFNINTPEDMEHAEQMIANGAHV